MMSNIDDIKKFEAMISDTIATFTHENAPFVRSVLGVTNDADVSHNVATAFFGHITERFYRSYGRAGTEAFIAVLLDRLDIVFTRLAEASAKGIELDPARAALDIIQGESAPVLSIVRGPSS